MENSNGRQGKACGSYSKLRKRLLPKHSLMKSELHFFIDPCLQLCRFSKAMWRESREDQIWVKSSMHPYALITNTIERKRE
jgi:hypothetical protein